MATLQRTLSRWYWPNYPASIRSRQALQACLESAWTRMQTFDNDRMRKTKKTFCSACMRPDLDILHRWSLSSFCMEGSWFCFCKMAMAVDIQIEVTWQCDDAWNLFATTWQFSKLGKLLGRSLMEFVVVKCWLEVQQRCKSVILAPSQYECGLQ